MDGAGNLPSDTTEAELQTLFESYGTVKEVRAHIGYQAKVGTIFIESERGSGFGWQTPHRTLQDLLQPLL